MRVLVSKELRELQRWSCGLRARRELFIVVLSEAAVESFVGIDAGELSDDFDSNNLGVGEFRLGGHAFGCGVFDEEAVKIRKKTSATSGAIGSTPSVGRSSLLLKSSKTKLAHRVSYSLPFSATSSLQTSNNIVLKLLQSGARN